MTYKSAARNLNLDKGIDVNSNANIKTNTGPGRAISDDLEQVPLSSLQAIDSCTLQ